MTPALRRMRAALPSRGVFVLETAVDFHGAAVVQAALAYEPKHAAIRRPLVCSLVKVAGFDLVLGLLGCDTIELLRDLASLTPKHGGARAVLSQAVASRRGAL